MGFTLLASVVGVLTSSYIPLNGPISFILNIVGVLYLAFTQNTPTTLFIRSVVLLALGFITGVGLNPLVLSAFEVSPTIVMNSVFGSVLIFFAFAAVAWNSDTQKILLMRSSISSLALGMLLFSFMRMFLPNYEWMTYLSTGVSYLFTGFFLVYHNATLIAESEAGHEDHVVGAYVLFKDFVSVFVKILMYLKNEEKNKQNSKKKRSRAAYD